MLNWIFWTPLVTYYAIGVFGFAYEPFYQRSIEMINSGSVRNATETAFIEHLEAMFWLMAFAAYVVAAIKKRKRNDGVAWLVFFALICLMALGEETSWGQHYFNFSPRGAFKDLNVQGEYNIHNLHIGKTIGLAVDNPLYRYLGNATLYLNPLFYLFCIMTWLVLPLTLNRFHFLGDSKFFRNYPSQNRSFYIAFSIAIAVYLGVDLFIFDAGELFELTLATTGCVTAVNCMKK